VNYEADRFVHGEIVDTYGIEEAIPIIDYRMDLGDLKKIQHLKIPLRVQKMFSQYPNCILELDLLKELAPTAEITFNMGIWAPLSEGKLMDTVETAIYRERLEPFYQWTISEGLRFLGVNNSFRINWNRELATELTPWSASVEEYRSSDLALNRPCLYDTNTPPKWQDWHHPERQKIQIWLPNPAT